MNTRCIDAYALQRSLVSIKPVVYEEDNGYDQGALDMWNLLYAAVTSAPTLKEGNDGTR